MYAVVFFAAHVHETVAGLEAVREDGRVQRNLAPYERENLVFRAVFDDLGV